MAQHKWHKEIKAWADDVEIQFKVHEFGEWLDIEDSTTPQWDDFYEYRIKPQPDEPQYLYVYARNGEVNYMYKDPRGWAGEYIGRVKLEVDDGN